MAEVSIIILNYKQKELTVNCVKSVLAQKYKDFEIILVENGSEDGSYGFLKKKFSQNEKIKVLEIKKNRGYAGGNNYGYKYAKGRFVVCLSNDTLVDKNWLVELVKAIKSGENVAIAVSAIVYVAELKNVSRYKNEIKNREVSTGNLLSYAVKISNKGRYIKTSAVAGASFIIKRKLFKSLFDEDYFVYCEDIKLGLMTIMRGYDVIFAPDSYFFHLGCVVKKTSKKINKHYTFLGERNRILNVLTFYSWHNLIRIFPLLIVNIILLNLSKLREMPYRLKSYFWIIGHPGFVSRKRREVHKQRKIKDKELIKLSSGKLYEEPEKGISRYALKAINWIFLGYCFLVVLRVREFQPKR